MNFTGIKNGKVEVFNEKFNLLRTIGNGDALEASLKTDGTLALITTVNGEVELWDEDSSLVITIENVNAKRATFRGEDIIILTENGTIESRKLNGEIIRVLNFSELAGESPKIQSNKTMWQKAG